MVLALLLFYRVGAWLYSKRKRPSLAASLAN